MLHEAGSARATPRRHRVDYDSTLPERFSQVAAAFAASATAGRILPAMPLPADFNWTTKSASRPDEPLAVIACHGVWVVAMAQRVNDGIWIASLDRHRHGPGGPFRWCSSYEQAGQGPSCGWPGTRHDCARTWPRSGNIGKRSRVIAC